MIWSLLLIFYATTWPRLANRLKSKENLLDRQARIHPGAGAGKAFRPRRRGLRRDAADAVGRREAARGADGRAAGQSRLALPGLHAGGPARAGMGAPHRRRHPRHARGDQFAAPRPVRAGCASPPSRPRWPWWRRSPRPIASGIPMFSSPSIRATRSRFSTCWKISRSTPASPMSRTSRSAASAPCRSIASVTGCSPRPTRRSATATA